MTRQFSSEKFKKLNMFRAYMFALVVVLDLVNWQATAIECGTINIPKGLTIEGNQTRKGFWPFAVSLYEIKYSQIFCGGTLISKKHVLTGIFEMFR